MTSRRAVQAVVGGLRVLETVAQRQPVGVTEVSRHTALDTSQVQRLLVTLNECGWIAPAPGRPRKWQLTSRLWHTMRGVASSLQLERAATQMRLLSAATGETVFLCAPQGGAMVVLDVSMSEAAIRVQTTTGVGSSFSSASASAAAIAAVLPWDRVVGVLAIPDGPDTAERLASIESVGYAIRRSGDGVAVASAVLDGSGYPFATLTLAAPEVRVTDGGSRLGKSVAEAARRASGSPAAGATDSPDAPSDLGLTGSDLIADDAWPVP
jgi:IclR family transcriptional regulator, acetate operon repressor